MKDGPQTLHGCPEYGMQEADWQGGVNLGSANTGKLSVALGNSHNPFKPQFHPLSRQVVMLPPGTMAKVM